MNTFLSWMFYSNYCKKVIKPWWGNLTWKNSFNEHETLDWTFILWLEVTIHSIAKKEAGKISDHDQQFSRAFKLDDDKKLRVENKDIKMIQRTPYIQAFE